MQPTVTHTYAPRGKTPIISVSGKHSVRLYLASAISPIGDLLFFIRTQPFNTKAIIEYLTYLREELKQKLIIIWDGASIHDSEELRQWLAQQEKGGLYLVQQPRYAPELNADEQVWYHLKHVKLKNKSNQNINELNKQVVDKFNFMKNDKDLITSFFKHPDLGYYN